MKTYPNVGRKTCDEVHTFIGKWLKNNLSHIFENDDDAKLVHKIIYDRSLLSIKPTELERLSSQIDQHDFNEPTTPIQLSPDEEIAYDWDEIIASDIPTLEKTLKIIATILDERDFEIVVLRFGLGGKKFTLQALGDKYGVTRERVRQIESRAMKKLRIPTYLTLLESVFSQREPILTDTLFRRSSVISVKALSLLKKDVTTNDLFLIEATYGSLKDWLSARFIAHRNGNRVTSWSKEELSEDTYSDENSGQGPIHIELLNHILQLPWPTSLSELHAKLPGCPPTLIAEILNERYGVEFVDGKITTIENLPMRHRLVIVLKCVGHGLHTSEIVSHHIKMFDIATNEHAVGAVLMRLDEALITARGVYDLYENLDFSHEHLSEIRDTVYLELANENKFISSKKLFENLFADKLNEYPEKLSDYMLHWIIQDDPRFDVRRGLMVGLKTDEYNGQFKSLQEEIWDLIDTKGPISVREIRQHLSSTRQVLDSTIEVSINSMQDVFANESKTFDKVERIFGSKEAHTKLLEAIQINLLRGPLSLFALKTKLDSIDLDLHERTLRSVLNTTSTISYSGKLVTLIHSPEHLQEYASFIEKSNLENIPEKLIHLAELDASYGSGPEPQKDKQKGVFNSIISEFEF